MVRIVVDENLHKKLQELDYPVELCDASGRVIGRFEPDLSNFDLEPPLPTEEELRVMEKELNDPNAKRYTTAEVLAHLERLGCSESNGPNPPSTP